MHNAMFNEGIRMGPLGHHLAIRKMRSEHPAHIVLVNPSSDIAAEGSSLE